MPIRGIDVYVRELKLTQETRISALSGTRLGIEGHNWLRLLLKTIHDGESVALGGVAQALEAKIAKNLKLYRDNQITPIFVFSGLPVARKDNRPFIKEDTRPSVRDNAWESYRDGHTGHALNTWAKAPTLAQSDLIPFVMKVLHAHGVEYMRAPYSSWAQLAYLYRHDLQPIHAVYASLDMLMFDVDRVIIEVDQSKESFTWLLRENMLTQCGIGMDQILDICLLAGTEWCPTFPALIGDGGFAFKFAVDVVRQYRTGFNTIQMLGDHQQQPYGSSRATSYSDSFLRAYSIVKYHIVMHLDGTVAPLNPARAPNDLHDVIGHRLPAPVYRLLAQGIIHPPVVNMLASGQWLEFPPADNGQSKEYRNLILDWETAVLRDQCALLCKSLGAFFKQRKVSMHVWFDPQNHVALHSPTSSVKGGGTRQSANAASEPVRVSQKAFDKYFSKRDNVSLKGVLEHSAELVLNQKASKPGNVESGGSMYAQAMLTVLADLGFISRSGQHTRLGSALEAGLCVLRKSAGREELQWSAMVLAILADQGVLSGSKWSTSYKDDTLAGKGASDQKWRLVRVLSRIGVLVPIGERRAGPWKLACSRDILAFCSAARLVQKTANTSADSAYIVLAVEEATTKKWPSNQHLEQLLELKQGMPVDCAANNASGLLVMEWLSDHINHGPGSWARLQAKVGDSISDLLGITKDLWTLTEATVEMTSVLAKGSSGSKSKGNSSLEQVAKDVKSGREWLHPILKQVSPSENPNRKSHFSPVLG